jgi:RND family efflux transporter MFP subunit
MESALKDSPRTARRDEPTVAGTAPISHDPHGPVDTREDHDEIPTVDSLPRPRRWMLIVGAVLVLIVLVGAFFAGLLPHMQRTAGFNAEANAVASQLPTVSVQFPTQTSATTQLDLPGSMRALQETSLYARTTGYLKKWNFDYGAKVNSGELLAEIDAPEVDEQLRMARAQLASDQANASKADLDLTYVSTTTQRFEALIKTNGVTPQELDMYHANTAKARTALLQAKASVQADEANVKRLEDLQSFEKITAPFAGTITARNYDVGALINANAGAGVQPLFRIEQLNVLRVWVSVPQGYSTVVRPGQIAKISVREYPGRLFDARVAHTAGALDPNTRTLLTEVQVQNADGKLFSGMFCNVQFNLVNPAPPLKIPISALISDAQGNQVAIVDSDNVAHYKAVTLGRDYGTTVEVLTGLEKSDRVITNPGQRLSDGGQVKVLNTPQPPATEKSSASTL